MMMAAVGAAVMVAATVGEAAACDRARSPMETRAVAPGDSYLLLLDAVTTARPGWGYKERTGFAFYPVRAAGPHTLAATCVNLFGRGTRTTTAAIALTLTPAAAP